MTKQEIINELIAIEEYIESCHSIYGIGSIRDLIVKLQSDINSESTPNKNLKPPRFYNLSEGVDPKKFGDAAMQTKETKK